MLDAHRTEGSTGLRGLVSLRHQHRRQDLHAAGLAPKEVIAPVNQDPSDPLHQLLHGLVETYLQNASKGRSNHAFGVIAKTHSWIDHNVKKGKENDETNGTNKFFDVLQQSIFHMGSKKNVGSFPDFVLNAMKVEKMQ